jgi:hypothetical protein
MAGTKTDEARRRIRLATVLGLLSLGLAGATPGWAEGPPGSVGAPSSTAHSTQGTELTSLRAPFSRTYLGDNGLYRTVISSEPVNYFANGSWQSIDTTLVPASGGGYRQTANSFETWLPPSLLLPVRASQREHAVQWKLEGASGALTVAGASGTYLEALPGVDVVYTARPDGVKEELILKSSASAVSRFRFNLTLTPGLRLEMTPEGVAQLVDAGGDAIFRLEAPYAIDSSGRLGSFDRASTVATSTPGGFTLDVTLDQEWLRSPDRVFPIIVDPTLVVGGTGQFGQPVYLDCLITSASLANSTQCDRDSFGTGNDGGMIYRTLMRWDVSDVPSTAVVDSAELRLNAPTVWPPGQSQSVNVHRMTRSHAIGATWNKYDGTNAWTAAGGDYSATVEASATLLNTNEWYSWFPTALVQGWVSGAISNQGLLLKAADESLANVNNAFWSAERTPTGFGPALIVAWSDGEPPQADS